MCWCGECLGSDGYLLLEGVPRQSLIEQSVDFICSTLETGLDSRVLDVGCGTGRHVLALAARGCLVTGIDSSAYMVQQCQHLAMGEPRFSVLNMDFRTMSFREEFDAALCWGNTLGCVTQEDAIETVKGMLASLIPGGAILIDLHNLAWYRDNARLAGVGGRRRESTSCRTWCTTKQIRGSLAGI